MNGRAVVSDEGLPLGFVVVVSVSPHRMMGMCIEIDIEVGSWLGEIC